MRQFLICEPVPQSLLATGFLRRRRAAWGPGCCSCLKINSGRRRYARTTTGPLASAHGSNANPASPTLTTAPGRRCRESSQLNSIVGPATLVYRRGRADVVAAEGPFTASSGRRCCWRPVGRRRRGTGCAAGLGGGAAGLGGGAAGLGARRDQCAAGPGTGWRGARAGSGSGGEGGGGPVRRGLAAGGAGLRGADS